MDAFRIFIFIYLFCLSRLLSDEAKEIDQDTFHTTNMTNYSNYYLNLEDYKDYEFIYFDLSFEIDEDVNFTLYISFSNTLNFSALSKTEYYTFNKKSANSGYKYYYALDMYPNYKYFLVRFISPMAKKAYFDHSRYSHINSVELKNQSSVFKGSDLIYLYLNKDFSTYFYFSFSFQRKNNTNITEYNIYYALNNYNDDIEYLNNSNYYKATNPRIKNNTYTFYYKLHKYAQFKRYALIRPGKETLKYDKINITRLPKLPYEFKKSWNITTEIHDYIYTNISDIPIGNDIYFIVIPIGNITIKYKFSEGNFYDDFTDMNLITPKYNYSSYNAEYYYFKKENDSNFL